jgi:hypothetical protein
MLVQIYVEALLANENLGDQVWHAWNTRCIDDATAWFAW